MITGFAWEVFWCVTEQAAIKTVAGIKYIFSLRVIVSFKYIIRKNLALNKLFYIHFYIDEPNFLTMQLNKLSTQRILSIDALRGITILVMIFVNELAGMRDIPQWMRHMPADVDAMSFVDVVFPGFLLL